MKEMKNKLAAVITVATKTEDNLRSEIKNATQTKHESPAIIAEKENKIKDLKQRFISLDEIRKGTRMSYECLLRDIVRFKFFVFKKFISFLGRKSCKSHICF